MMAISRRAFVRTLGGGAAGAWSAAVIGARGSEALAGSGGAVQPPTAGKQVVWLDSNENPYGPGGLAIAALRGSFDESNRYPYRSGEALPEAIAAFHSVPKDHVLAGCGSGELLRVAVQAFTSPARGLVTALPTFEIPTRTAMFLKHLLHEVPVDGALRLDLGAMADKAAGAGLVFFCNPNNPTGTLHGKTAVADFVARVGKASPDTVILMDEAYFDYADDQTYGTAIPLALEHPQVVVTRTFSKVHGMAGLRIGYAIGRPQTLAKMAPWRLGNGINILGIRAAVAALGDTANMARSRQANAVARGLIARTFSDLGYRVVDSHTNFVFADLRRDASEFAKRCLAENIVVGRPFPPLTTWTRVSVGTAEETRQAVEVFRRLLTKAS